MVNLIDLIYKEFERSGYISSDGFLWKHHKYKDYWVVWEVAGDYVLTELQNWIVGKLAEERAKEPEMEKNTSLLIIRKVKSSSGNLERVIAEENDVYVFKKYVLQYTEVEWNCVKTLYADGSMPLSDILMMSDIFEKVRDNQCCPEALLYRIAHKLPFATMNVAKKEYEYSDNIVVPDVMNPLLEWVDEIPACEGKAPSEQELNAMKELVQTKVESETMERHED